MALLGPIHTNAFSKVSIFISVKTKDNIFIHTSIFVSFSPIQTKMLENHENNLDLGLHNRVNTEHP